jgi:hypothetical protein
MNIRSNIDLPKYGIDNIYRKDNFMLWIKINNKKYSFVDFDDSGKLPKAIVKCDFCNESWGAILNNLFRGTGCSYCAGLSVGKINNLKYLFPYLSEEWDYELNEKSPEQYVPGSNVKVSWRCNLCDHRWMASIKDRSYGRGCPRCSSSKMEKYIKNFAIKNNILFETQKRFDDCRDNKPLPFDFYFPEYNALCEANGKQHYEQIEYWGGKERFEYRQMHDQIKRKYCENKAIKLIEISYLDQKNIESILIQELNLKGGTY